MDDLEKKILNKEIDNEYDKLKDYIIKQYN